MRASRWLWVAYLATLTPICVADDGGFFVEGRYGRSDLLNISNTDEEPVGWLGGGYWFNKYFAVEGGYVRLFDQVRNFESLKLDTLYAGVKGRMLFERHSETGFFVGGRAGIHHWDYSGAYGRNGTSRYIGAFVGYQFTPSLSVSLNYDAFDAGRYEARAATIAVEYKF